MTIQEYLDSVNEQMERRIAGMDTVMGNKLNLDIRAGHALHVDEECIIVEKQFDRWLQYYGGFEYVDKDYRYEVGNYVIYLNDGEKVERCLDFYYDREEAED